VGELRPLLDRRSVLDGERRTVAVRLVQREALHLPLFLDANGRILRQGVDGPAGSPEDHGGRLVFLKGGQNWNAAGQHEADDQYERCAERGVMMGAAKGHTNILP
jgi:hypothetical protein